MANFVLDVSRIPDGSAAAVAYRFCSAGSDNQHIDLTPSADGLVIGVVMDNLDAAKVVEGGAVAVRVLGIAPVQIGTGTAVVGSYIATGADGKGVVTTTAATKYGGIALQSGTVGGIIDVLLTPGAKV